MSETVITDSYYTSIEDLLSLKESIEYDLACTLVEEYDISGKLYLSKNYLSFISTNYSSYQVSYPYIYIYIYYILYTI